VAQACGDDVEHDLARPRNRLGNLGSPERLVSLSELPCLHEPILPRGGTRRSAGRDDGVDDNRSRCSAGSCIEISLQATRAMVPAMMA
jgi:hypothetical protein